MSVIYDGAHSITFTTTDGLSSQNTWDQWFLIPTSRPTMSIPGAQNRFVEIPGMNGSYDLSDYLTPDVTYSDRSGSFEFIVDTDEIDWRTAYQMIVIFLHGKRLRMILSDDPEWYYEGRFTVDHFQSDQSYSKITISYRVSPFKTSIYSDFVENILWDTFNFELDYDYSVFWHIQSTNVTKSYNIETLGLQTTISVRLVSGGPVVASFGGVTKTLSTVGSIESLGNSNPIGHTTLTLTGNGVIDAGWQKTSL